MTFDRCDWPLRPSCTARPRYSVVDPRAERPKGLHVCPAHAAVAVQASWNICNMVDESAPVGAFDELPGTKPRRDPDPDELPHLFEADADRPDHCRACGGWPSDRVHQAQMVHGERVPLAGGSGFGTLATSGPRQDLIDDLGAAEPPPAPGGLVPFQCQDPVCGYQFMADRDTTQCVRPGCHAFVLAVPMPADDPAAVAGLGDPEPRTVQDRAAEGEADAVRRMAVLDELGSGRPEPVQRVAASLEDMRSALEQAWGDVTDAVLRLHTAAYDAVRTWDQLPVGSVQVPQQVYTVMATLAAAAGYDGPHGRTLTAQRWATLGEFQAAAGGLAVELHDDHNIFIRQPRTQHDDVLIHVTNVGALRDALEFTRLERDARARAADQNRTEDTDHA